MCEQFSSGDMSRIRNKGAYLWGIVRNVQSGTQSGRGKGMMYGGDYSGSGQGVDGGAKMLWPEEEQVPEPCMTLLLFLFSSSSSLRVNAAVLCGCTGKGGDK